MNKRILVTGASRGIGKEIAQKFAKDGYDVFITSRNINLLKEIAEKISAVGYCECDLSINEDLEKLGSFIEQNKIDVLVNNAGEYFYGGIDKTDLQIMEKIYSVNLKAPAYLSSVVVKNMKNNKWGRIINIGSISGVMGEANASLYSSSKSGLIGLSKALALELAQDGITVNVINPGWVETEMCSESIEQSEFSLEETLQCIPQKRFVEPAEVANLIAYLISDNAKGVTGQSINLCAGLSLGF